MFRSKTYEAEKTLRRIGNQGARILRHQSHLVPLAVVGMFFAWGCLLLTPFVDDDWLLVSFCSTACTVFASLLFYWQPADVRRKILKLVGEVLAGLLLAGAIAVIVLAAVLYLVGVANSR